jgi:hypothetical protein
LDVSAFLKDLSPVFNMTAWKMKGSQNKDLNGKFRNARPVGKPRTRWEDVVRWDTTQILGIRRWKRRAGNREGWKRLLREAGVQKEL